MKIQLLVTVVAVCVLAVSAVASTSLPCLTIKGVCHIKDTLQACSKGVTCVSGKCRDPCSSSGGSCGGHSGHKCCDGNKCVSGKCRPECSPLGGCCGGSKPHCCNGNKCVS